jgi:hypothetical protein
MKWLNKALFLGTVLMIVVAAGAWSRFWQPAPPSVAIGTQLENGLFERNSWTIVAIVKSTCRYCTASMPFYVRLRENFASVPFVVAGRESEEDLLTYTTSHAVKGDRYVQVPAEELGRIPTPTLLLVGPSGIVRAVWQGELEKSRERSVLRALTGLMSAAPVTKAEF